MKKNQKQAKFSLFKKKKQTQKQKSPNTYNNKFQLNLSLQFHEVPPSQYTANKIYEEKGMERIEVFKEKVQTFITQSKQLGNCQFAQNQHIQDEDSLKLMNFIVGGYVDNDFEDYLSFNQFNQKKDEFDMLKEVYETTAKKYKQKKLDNEMQVRSLHSAIYLNQNLNKISRVSVQQFLKKNKMVW